MPRNPRIQINERTYPEVCRRRTIADSLLWASLQQSPFQKILPKEKPLTKKQLLNLEIRELKSRLQGALDVLSGKATADYND